MNEPITIDEVEAMQDLRRFVFIRADEFNSVERAYLAPRFRLVGQLLTKLKNQVSNNRH